ncbi:MAG: tRNA pseudouridine(55) synthase TruB [Saprospirales bacterium]|nr:MAG: tRNA pseudouridine(55) synthase TruB [Saprospirales bacterium]
MRHFTKNDPLSQANPKEGFTVAVYKPSGWTSFDLVAKLRGRLKYVLNKKKVKIGHGGTLDPLATGLVIIGIGPGTKSLNQWIDATKEYVGIIKLGAVTASFDGETEEENRVSTADIRFEEIKSAVSGFIGEIYQRPPVFSALKKDGVPLYKMARRGEHVLPEKRLVKIFEFEILSFNNPEIEFRVVCSKGTYIRSLAHDLGQVLGLGGYLSSLNRTAVGEQRSSDAFEIDDLVFALGSVVGAIRSENVE